MRGEQGEESDRDGEKTKFFMYHLCDLRQTLDGSQLKILHTTMEMLNTTTLGSYLRRFNEVIL